MGEKRGASGFWCGNLRDKDNLDDPGVNGRMILKLIFRKWDGESIDWIRIGTVGRALVNAVMNLRVP
jgi:hypothetical protein